MYDGTAGPAAGAPSGFSASAAVAASAYPPAPLPGDLVIAPESLSAPGLRVAADGALSALGGLAAADVGFGDGSSLSNEIRLASFARVRDGELSDRHFRRALAIPPSSFRDVLPPAMGGTGADEAPAPAPGPPGRAPVLAGGNAGGLEAAAGGAAAVGDLYPDSPAGAPALLSLPGGVRLFPPGTPPAAALAGAPHHLLSAAGAGGGLLASHSDSADQAVAVVDSDGAPASWATGEARPAVGPVTLERLSFSRAAFSVDATPGTAPLSNVSLALYAADGEDPAPAERPRGPEEVFTGLSPLPYGLPPSEPDPGLLTVTRFEATGALTTVRKQIFDVPARAHRAARAVAGDARGNLSEVSSLAWDTEPPLARSTAQPAFAGLTVSFAASNVPRALPGGSSAGLDAGPTRVRPGLLATELLTPVVPGFSNSVGALPPAALPFAGGLSRGNAASEAGPELAWALWESVSNALEAASPLLEVPPGQSSNLEFGLDRHLAFDGSRWTEAANGYSSTYKPFLLLGDSFSNLRVHLFETEFVYIPNPEVPVRFLEFDAGGASVTAGYELLDDLVDVVARVFPLTPELGAGSNLEPGDAADPAPEPRTFQLSSATGQHEVTLDGLAHTTFHRLVVETLDLAGLHRRDFYDFRTAAPTDPAVELSAASVGPGGVADLAWTASDSNDGGISAVTAFSGATFPVPDSGLRDRLLSAEDRVVFPGTPPGLRTLSDGPGPEVSGRALFSNAADLHHLSHYVQLVAEDAASEFHSDSNRLAAVDFGAEVPAFLSNVSEHQLPARFENRVAVRQLAFEADTQQATAFLVALSQDAAAALFPDGASQEEAASNLWALVEGSSNLFAPAISGASLLGSLGPLP